MQTKIKVGIVGSTGYTGLALIELLLRHPNVTIQFLGSEQYQGKKFSEVYPAFKGILDKKCAPSTLANLKACDFIFYATPNGICHKMAPKLVKAGKKIVDLSADYRFRNKKTYEKWYGFKRSDRDDTKLIKDSIYGLVEIKRDEITKAIAKGKLSLIGNPGCYTTASILALSPILEAHASDTSKEALCDLGSIIIDAKSGVSGAGRKANLSLNFSEVNEGLAPYNLANQHRHTPELEAFFSELTDEDIELSFSPHLIPMTKGLLTTCYISLNPKRANALCKKYKSRKLEDAVHKLYTERYQDEEFVEVLDKGTYPNSKWVVGTNKTHIQVSYDERLNRLIITSAMDNLIKGAAGQAIQNMNLLMNLPENLALELSPQIP